MALLRIDRHDQTAVVTLNDPERRNALTPAMVDEIVTAFDEFEADERIGAVVITGAPPAFCAGADLGDLSRATPESLKAIYEGFVRVGRSTLPTVAAVNGAAVGAGMNLALACDLRLAGSRAKFDTRFAELGLHPGGGHTWMLRNTVGLQNATAMVLFSQVLDAEAAERAGLVWRVVADADLLPEAIAVAERAAATPQELTAVIKTTLRATGGITEHQTALEEELGPQVWSTRQPWFAERIAALQARITSR